MNITKKIHVLLYLCLAIAGKVYGAAAPNYDEASISDLIYAVTKGNCYEVKKLLANGISANACDDYMTALTYAAAYGHKDVINILLAHKANVNIINHKDNSTALIYAAFYSHPDAVKILLAHGAALDVVNKNGDTALSIATRSSYTGAAQLLQAAAQKQAAETTARLDAEKTARLVAEKQAAETKARLVAEKQAAEKTARLVAEKQAAETTARLAAEKQAAETTARLETEKQAAETTARLVAEKQALETTARLVAEEIARLEIEKQAAETTARLVAEKIARLAADKAMDELVAQEERAKAKETKKRPAAAAKKLATKAAETTKAQQTAKKPMTGKAAEIVVEKAKQAAEIVTPAMEQIERLATEQQEAIAAGQGTANGLSRPQRAGKQAATTADKECLICTDAIQEDNGIQLTCGHEMCLDCAGQLILDAIQETATPTAARCFSDTCSRQSFTENDIEKICLHNPALKEKYNSFLTDTTMAKLRNVGSSKLTDNDSFENEESIRQCCHCKKDFFTTVKTSISKRKKIKKLSCPYCAQFLCSTCYLPYHEGLSCADKKKAEEGAAPVVESNEIKLCPTCDFSVLKEGEGCNFVICSRCPEWEWCWYCKKRFKIKINEQTRLKLPKQGHTPHECADGQLIHTAYGLTLQEARERIKAKQSRS